MSWNSKTSKRKNAVRLGYRSGLEKEVAEILTKHKIEFEFEPKDFKLPWHIKSKKKSLSCMKCGCTDIREDHSYTPDFVLEDRFVILESKGRFMSPDRVKMAALQGLYPDHLFIMLFSNPNGKTSPKTKNYEWCDKKGIKWLSFKDKDWVFKMNRMIKEWKKEQKKKKK